MTVAWNPADKAANVTLTASLGVANLVATNSTGAQGLVRATASTSAKVYIEGIAVSDTGNWSLGFANTTQSLTAQLGSSANGFAVNGNGNVFFNNTVIGTIGTNFSTPNLVRIALDPVAKLIWCAIGNAPWNNNVLADPATGVGGFSLAGIAAGPYFPCWGSAATGSQVLGVFGGTSTWFTAPSGYATLDTNVQTYIASPKFLGYGILGPPQNAVSTPKFLGYGILGPPQKAMSVFKFLGYAILVPSVPSGRSLRGSRSVLDMLFAEEEFRQPSSRRFSPLPSGVIIYTSPRLDRNVRDMLFAEDEFRQPSLRRFSALATRKRPWLFTVT